MLVQTVYDGEFQRPILLLDSQYKAHLYPDNVEMKKLFSEVANNYYMIIVNKTSGLISGYSFLPTTVQGPMANQVWNFHLPYELNRLVSIKTVFKRPHEYVHSQGRVLGDRNVLYKYLNPNLVVILCESLDTQDKCKFYFYDSFY